MSVHISLPQQTWDDVIERQGRIVGQHDAFDMFMFLRRNDPAFIAETLQNRAKRPRCVNHSDRPMATYEGEDPLCDDCYVAVVEARMGMNSYMVTGDVEIEIDGQQVTHCTQTEVQAKSEDEASAAVLEMILSTAQKKDPYASVKWDGAPIVRETETLTWQQ